MTLVTVAPRRYGRACMVGIADVNISVFLNRAHFRSQQNCQPGLFLKAGSSASIEGVAYGLVSGNFDNWPLILSWQENIFQDKERNLR